MIIKGKSRAAPGQLADHLTNAEMNEKVSLLETKGTVASDLHGALLEMAAVAIGTQCKKSLYHAMLSPEMPHRLTGEQRAEAVDALEKRLGLDSHARVVVMHEKLGREHLHVVWSRINIELMKSVSDSHNYRKHEEVSRDLERRFGHNRIQGAHHERDGVARPDRTPSRSELRQEERTGLSGKVVRAEVTAAFRASDSPEAFKQALAGDGYILAKGDRRDFVVVDRAGGVHSLARRLDGMKAASLRDFMASINRETLPTADQARETALGRMRAAAEAKNERQEDKLEKSYGRGEDYVSQSQAAQRDFAARQKRLDRAAQLSRMRMQAARERQQAPGTDHRHDAGPNNRPSAPGGGRTRSR